MMPINYRVQAEVVDIRNDQPVAGDQFFVDTNVWLWTAYTKATAVPYQTHSYPAYLSKARRAGAGLFRCGLSHSEIAHQIERTEREIFETANPGMGAIRPKEYRHNYPAERANVTVEVTTAWQQIAAMTNPVDVLVDEPLINAAMARFQSQPLDGYDLFMVEAIAEARIVQVLTDDGDYCTVPGVRVFTANQNVITRATAQGKLVIR